VLQDIPGLDFGISLTTETGVRVFDEAHRDHGLRPLPPGSYSADLSIPPILTVGSFTVGLWMGTAHENIVYEDAVAGFTLSGNSEDRPHRIVALGLPLAVHRTGDGS
jgi:ABC-2 type transport system ATP-binding protein/lipopolysaccharide transport system ATP-binding protein